MTMTAASRPLWSGIDYQLLGARVGTCHHVNAAGFETFRLQIPWLRLFAQYRDRALAQQQDCLFSERCTDLNRIALKNDSADRQRIGEMLGTIASRVENPAPVVVSKILWRTGLCECRQYFQHFFQN